MINYIAKILRSFYKRMKQGNLPTFVRAIISKMENDARYANLADVLTKLKTANEAFEAALAAAEDGSKQKVADKNLLKTALVAVLDELSDGVEFFGKKEMSYFLGTGLPLQSKKTNHSGLKLSIPIDFIAKSNGQPGGVQVSYGIEPSQKGIFKMVGYEWTLDQENWHNGDYGSKRKFDVANMPSNQKIYVKIRAIGTDGRKSPWTDAVQTSVL